MPFPVCMLLGDTFVRDEWYFRCLIFFQKRAPSLFLMLFVAARSACSDYTTPSQGGFHVGTCEVHAGIYKSLSGAGFSEGKVTFIGLSSVQGFIGLHAQPVCAQTCKPMWLLWLSSGRARDAVARG